MEVNSVRLFENTLFYQTKLNNFQKKNKFIWKNKFILFYITKKVQYFIFIHQKLKKQLVFDFIKYLNKKY